MPNRNVHIKCSYMYLKFTGRENYIDAVSVIETLIDHPKRLSGLLSRYIREVCQSDDSLECRLAKSLYYNFHIKGVFSHDWQSNSGRRLLKSIVEWLYGSDVSELVDLHFALDNVYTFGVKELSESVSNNRIKEFVLENCLSILE